MLRIAHVNVPQLAIASGWCTSVQNPNRGPWTGSISTEGADRYKIENENTSVYFLDSIEFSPQWILDLGLRWDDYSAKQTMTYGARNSAVLGNSQPIQQQKLAIK